MKKILLLIGVMLWVVAMPQFLFATGWNQQFAPAGCNWANMIFEGPTGNCGCATWYTYKPWTSYANLDKCEEIITCPAGQRLDDNNTCVCNEPVLDDQGKPTSECLQPSQGEYGIECSSKQLLNGTCKFNTYNALGIRQSDPNTSPTEFVQDIVLAATSFIGTILVVALIVSALMIIFGGADENMATKGRTGIKYALIGFVVVTASYAIIRLIQYIVSG
jgi:hypothetical protein